MFLNSNSFKRKWLPCLLAQVQVFSSAGWVFAAPARVEGLRKFSLSPGLGRVVERVGAGSLQVIHIQDLHCQYEVQQNIAAILAECFRQLGTSWVGCEGAENEVDVSPLSDQSEPLRAGVGSRLMRAGLVTGAEYFAARNRGACRLEGIDNREVYRQARELLPTFMNPEIQGLVLDLRQEGLTGPRKVPRPESKFEALEKYLNISATEAEAGDCGGMQDAAWRKELSGFARPEDMGRLLQALRQAGGFYRLTDRRSRIFFERMEKEIRARKGGPVVVITGGFHTRRLLGLLAQKGYSAISIQPACRNPGAANPYFSLLLGREQILRNLLAAAPKGNAMALWSLFQEDPGILTKLIEKFGGEARGKVKARPAASSASLSVPAMPPGRFFYAGILGVLALEVVWPFLGREMSPFFLLALQKSPWGEGPQIAENWKAVRKQATQLSMEATKLWRLGLTSVETMGLEWVILMTKFPYILIRGKYPVALDMKIGDREFELAREIDRRNDWKSKWEEDDPKSLTWIWSLKHGKMPRTGNASWEALRRTDDETRTRIYLQCLEQCPEQAVKYYPEFGLRDVPDLRLRTREIMHDISNVLAQWGNLELVLENPSLRAVVSPVLRDRISILFILFGDLKNLADLSATAVEAGSESGRPAVLNPAGEAGHESATLLESFFSRAENHKPAGPDESALAELKIFRESLRRLLATLPSRPTALEMIQVRQAAFGLGFYEISRVLKNLAAEYGQLAGLLRSPGGEAAPANDPAEQVLKYYPQIILVKHFLDWKHLLEIGDENGWVDLRVVPRLFAHDARLMKSNRSLVPVEWTPLSPAEENEPLWVQSPPEGVLAIALLNNLITNAQRAHARKFGEESKKTGRAMPPVHLSIRREHSWGVLEVTDRGDGFPENTTPKIFDTGATHGGLGGTGLGLTKGRLNRLGRGKMEIQSTPGAGTTVRLYFPIARSEPKSSEDTRRLIGFFGLDRPAAFSGQALLGSTRDVREHPETLAGRWVSWFKARGLELLGLVSMEDLGIGVWKGRARGLRGPVEAFWQSGWPLTAWLLAGVVLDSLLGWNAYWLAAAGIFGAAALAGQFAFIRQHGPRLSWKELKSVTAGVVLFNSAALTTAGLVFLGTAGLHFYGALAVRIFVAAAVATAARMAVHWGWDFWHQSGFIPVPDPEEFVQNLDAFKLIQKRDQFRDTREESARSQHILRVLAKFRAFSEGRLFEFTRDLKLGFFERARYLFYLSVLRIGFLRSSRAEQEAVAWALMFHDLGYAAKNMTEHEMAGAVLVEKFLTERRSDPKVVALAEKMVLHHSDLGMVRLGELRPKVLEKTLAEVSLTFLQILNALDLAGLGKINQLDLASLASIVRFPENFRKIRVDFFRHRIFSLPQNTGLNPEPVVIERRTLELRVREVFGGAEAGLKEFLAHKADLTDGMAYLARRLLIADPSYRKYAKFLKWLALIGQSVADVKQTTEIVFSTDLEELSGWRGSRAEALKDAGRRLEEWLDTLPDTLSPEQLRQELKAAEAAEFRNLPIRIEKNRIRLRIKEWVKQKDWIIQLEPCGEILPKVVVGRLVAVAVDAESGDMHLRPRLEHRHNGGPSLIAMFKDPTAGAALKLLKQENQLRAVLVDGEVPQGEWLEAAKARGIRVLRKPGLLEEVMPGLGAVVQGNAAHPVLIVNPSAPLRDQYKIAELEQRTWQGMLALEKPANSPVPVYLDGRGGGQEERLDWIKKNPGNSFFVQTRKASGESGISGEELRDLSAAADGFCNCLLGWRGKKDLQKQVRVMSRLRDELPKPNLRFWLEVPDGNTIEEARAWAEEAARADSGNKPESAFEYGFWFSLPQTGEGGMEKFRGERLGRVLFLAPFTYQKIDRERERLYAELKKAAEWAEGKGAEIFVGGDLASRDMLLAVPKLRGLVLPAEMIPEWAAYIRKKPAGWTPVQTLAEARRQATDWMDEIVGMIRQKMLFQETLIKAAVHLGVTRVMKIMEEEYQGNLLLSNLENVQGVSMESLPQHSRLPLLHMLARLELFSRPFLATGAGPFQEWRLLAHLCRWRMNQGLRYILGSDRRYTWALAEIEGARKGKPHLSSGERLGYGTEPMELSTLMLESERGVLPGYGLPLLSVQLFGPPETFLPLPESVYVFKIAGSRKFTNAEFQQIIAECRNSENVMDRGAVAARLLELCARKGIRSPRIGLLARIRNAELINVLALRMGIPETRRQGFWNLVESAVQRHGFLELTGSRGVLRLYADNDWVQGLDAGSEQGVDVYLGGGAPAALVSAALVQKLGGAMAAMLVPANQQEFSRKEQEALFRCGFSTRESRRRIFSPEQLVRHAEQVIVSVLPLRDLKLGNQTIPHPVLAEDGTEILHVLGVFQNRVEKVVLTYTSRVKGLKESLNKSPHDPELNIRLALTYAELGHLDVAREWLETCPADFSGRDQKKMLEGVQEYFEGLDLLQRGETKNLAVRFEAALKNLQKYEWILKETSLRELVVEIYTWFARQESDPGRAKAWLARQTEIFPNDFQIWKKRLEAQYQDWMTEYSEKLERLQDSAGFEEPSLQKKIAIARQVFLDRFYAKGKTMRTWADGKRPFQIWAAWLFLSVLGDVSLDQQANALSALRMQHQIRVLRVPFPNEFETGVPGKTLLETIQTALARTNRFKQLQGSGDWLKYDLDPVADLDRPLEVRPVILEGPLGQNYLVRSAEIGEAHAEICLSLGEAALGRIFLERAVADYQRIFYHWENVGILPAKALFEAARLLGVLMRSFPAEEQYAADFFQTAESLLDPDALRKKLEAKGRGDAETVGRLWSLVRGYQPLVRELLEQAGQESAPGSGFLHPGKALLPEVFDFWRRAERTRTGFETLAATLVRRAGLFGGVFLETAGIPIPGRDWKTAFLQSQTLPVLWAAAAGWLYVSGGWPLAWTTGWLGISALAIVRGQIQFVRAHGTRRPYAGVFTITISGMLSAGVVMTLLAPQSWGSGIWIMLPAWAAGLAASQIIHWVWDRRSYPKAVPRPRMAHFSRAV